MPGARRSGGPEPADGEGRTDAPALRPMRRRDRAVEDPAWIRDFLERVPVGVLATADGGRPLLHVNLFCFDRARDAIYLHTARAGRTRETVGAHPAVCFAAYELGRFLPADRALEFSVEFASVVTLGRIAIVTEAGEARRALASLLAKYAPHLRPGADYRPITDDELERTTVYRIEIDAWSGKRKAVGEHPGAYPWPPPGASPEPGGSEAGTRAGVGT